MKASDKGHTEVVQILLEHGADSTLADKNGFAALSLAAKAGKASTVKALLESEHARPDVNFLDTVQILTLSLICAGR